MMTVFVTGHTATNDCPIGLDYISENLMYVRTWDDGTTEASQWSLLREILWLLWFKDHTCEPKVFKEASLKA